MDIPLITIKMNTFTLENYLIEVRKIQIQIYH